MAEAILPNSKKAIPKTSTEALANEGTTGYPALNEYVTVQDPPDEPGDEMTYGARVWKTYVRETDRADRELVEGRNSSLDVLLIFAALFSAISTAFVIESIGDLKPDPAESSAETLLVISKTLVAIANGQPVDSSSLDNVGTPAFAPSRTAVAVNVLWFLSLSLSVAVSLIAMLAKEWCYMFMSRRSGPVYEQARRRQERWNGIERWKMTEVVTYLPSLMHLALRLSLYLWDTNVVVAVPFVVVTATASLIYIGASVMVFFDKFCPYTTPATLLLQLVPVVLHGTSNWILRRIGVPGWLFAALWKIKSTTEPKDTGIDNSFSVSGVVPMDIVTSQMLNWLVRNCEDFRSVDTAIQAFAGGTPEILCEPFSDFNTIRTVTVRMATHINKWSDIPDEVRSKDRSLLALTVVYSRINNLLSCENQYSDIIHMVYQYEADHPGTYIDHRAFNLLVSDFICRHVNMFSNPTNLAFAIATALPICHRDRDQTPDVLLIQRKAPEMMASLLQNHLNSEGPSLSPNALRVLVESSVHYLVGLYPRQTLEQRQSLIIVLLAQLYILPTTNTTDIRKTIATTLAATSFAIHSYPGGEEPSEDLDSRKRRALQVLHHYQTLGRYDIFPLFTFGLLGLLPGTDAACWTQYFPVLARAFSTLDLQDNTYDGLYTLAETFTPEHHRILSGTRCLLLVSQTTFTPDAERVMLSSCLQQLLSGHISNSNFDLELYIATLAALCHAQSTELQSFCIQILSDQPLVLSSSELLETMSEHRILDHLHRVAASDYQHTAPTTILHTILLVTTIISAADLPFGARQAALRPLAKGDSEILQTLPQDYPPTHILDLYSYLAKVVQKIPNLETLEHVVQSVTEFCRAVPTEKSLWSMQVDWVVSYPEWHRTIQKLKDGYQPELLLNNPLDVAPVAEQATANEEVKKGDILLNSEN